MSSDFAPTQAEVALTNKIFEKCDPQKLGIITGDSAVGVFNGTKLSAGVLVKVWGIADKDNNGILTRKGVSIALRLMGHAQRGEEVSEALISKREYTPFAPPLQPFWRELTRNSRNATKHRGFFVANSPTTHWKFGGPGQIASTTRLVGSTINPSRQSQIHEDILRVQPSQRNAERCVKLCWALDPHSRSKYQ